jgi:hypothetical protein
MIDTLGIIWWKSFVAYLMYYSFIRMEGLRQTAEAVDIRYSSRYSNKTSPEFNSRILLLDKRHTFHPMPVLF